MNLTEQAQQQVAKKARIISIPEAKEILSKIDPEKTDQIQKRTMDYLLKFSKIEPDKARKIRKTLTDECGLTLEEATELKIIMPKSQVVLRVFSAGWRKFIPASTVENILNVLYD